MHTETQHLMTTNKKPQMSSEEHAHRDSAPDDDKQKDTDELRGTCTQRVST